MTKITIKSEKTNNKMCFGDLDLFSFFQWTDGLFMKIDAVSSISIYNGDRQPLTGVTLVDIVKSVDITYSV